MIKKNKILFGIKVNGSLHLGHYHILSRLLNYKKNGQQILILIADIHSLNKNNLNNINNLIKNLVLELLSIGFEYQDFFLQSQCHKIYQLNTYLKNFVTLSQILRINFIKEKLKKSQKIFLSLLNYPILMTADILFFHNYKILIGQDQKQNIEFVTTLSKKFFLKYNYYKKRKLTKKQFLFTKNKFPGLNGKKMSKSLNNSINIFDKKILLKNKINKILSDNNPYLSVKNKTIPLYKISQLLFKTQFTELLKLKLSYKELKKKIFLKIITKFEKERKKKETIKTISLKKILLNTQKIIQEQKNLYS